MLWQAANVTSPTGTAAGPERLLFVGMMGAGKSSVALLVGARRGWAVVDTDELVERRTGISVAEFFATKGEQAFRAAESEAVRELGETVGPLVASVGGGAVLLPENRDVMRALGTVVWLRARPESLAKRVGRGHGRPLLSGPDEGGPAAVLARLTRERGPLYEQVADVVIDVDELTAAQVAQRVLHELQRRRD